MTDERRESEPTSLTSLPPQTCRQLLGSTRVARVAYVEDGRPHLVVMNHLPDGDDVLLQTNEESSLARLTADGGRLAAVLEVDSASASEHAGWSVIASGELARESAEGVDRLPAPWRPEAVGVLLRLRVEEITGRHVGR